MYNINLTFIMKNAHYPGSKQDVYVLTGTLMFIIINKQIVLLTYTQVFKFIIYLF